METPADGRTDGGELPSVLADVQNHSRAEALAMVEALIDFPPEAGTRASTAWLECIATLLCVSRKEGHAHPHARRRGAPPPTLMSQ